MGWDVWLTCTSHAFSTEKQEIMGLLLGRWPQADELADLAARPKHRSEGADDDNDDDDDQASRSAAAFEALVGRVAVVEQFFDIIYSVHVESAGDTQLRGRAGKHCGQKRTYRAVS